MSGWREADAAELMESPIADKRWRGPRASTRVMAGTVGEIARFLQQGDPEEIWRFSIVTAGGDHIRSAELRALLRDIDPPA